MLNRIKNPIFLLAIAGLLFKILSQYFTIDLNDFQLVVDLIAYALIGTGIYHTFGKK